MDGRRIALDVLYNNQKISADLEPYITNVTFTDNLSGEADTVSISLGDREKKWMNSWVPKEGSTLKVDLLLSAGWDSEKKSKRKLGIFEIDEVGTNGPPNKVDVGATSVPESSTLRGEKKTRSWEKTNLKKVAQDIATKNSLKLFFLAAENPDYERLDQESETDVAFLMRICKEAGSSLKIANKSISILDEEKLESEPVVDTVKRTDLRLKGYSGKLTTSGAYQSCKVTYTIKQKAKSTEKTKVETKTIQALATDEEKEKEEKAAAKKKKRKEKSKVVNKSYSYTFTPPNAPKTKRTLIVNEEVSSIAAAKQLAKKKLREANKDGMTFSIKLAGFSNYYAGQTLQIKDFGTFDGKYIITSVNGVIGSGSELSLELRKCLEGY